MKFGSALSTNILEEWKDFYINYLGLKKQLHLPTHLFLAQLQQERTKILDFYNSIIQHIELMAIEPTWNDLFEFLNNPVINKHSSMAIQINHFQSIEFNHPANELVTYYQYLCHLQNYSRLNYSGLRKICKKYDKCNNINISDKFMSQVVQDQWYTNNTRLNTLKSACIIKYSHVSSQSVEYCSNYLEKHMTDLIVFKKNTVWRDMQQTISTTKKWQDSYDYKFTKTKFIYFAIHFTIFLFFLLVIPRMSFITHFTHNTIYQNNCCGVLLAVIYLWATEAIPLFTTALLIPLLLVIRSVLTEDINGQQVVLDSPLAAKLIFTEMFYSPIIILLLGGFTLASALSKYRILQSPCDSTIKHCNHSTYKVLFVLMNLATFISGITSNVAAPVLCTSLIHSLLKQTDIKIGKSLILGIAMSSNIGGMITPISSPQNIITIHLSSIKWIEWLFVTIPVCLLCNVLIFLLIIAIVQPNKVIGPRLRDDEEYRATDVIDEFDEQTDHTSGATGVSNNSGNNSDEDVPLLPSYATRDRLLTRIYHYYDTVQWIIVASSVAILLLWIATPFIKDFIGDVSIVSLIPILFYFGFGFLDKNDFNDLLWSVVVLAQGGILLGKAIDNTGLLHLIAQYLSYLTNTMSILQVLLTFSIFTLVAASMISHTVAALIILPMIKEIGMVMAINDENHVKLLIMGIGLICSAAMALPISGFPNMHAINVEDPNTGIRYLTTADFIKVGVPSSIISMIVVCSVGYGLMGILHM